MGIENIRSQIQKSRTTVGRPSAISIHQMKVKRKLQLWQNKPLLREIYYDFYRTIAKHLWLDVNSRIVELGSGIGSIKAIIPQCICTDIFESDHIDQVESVYNLSFESNTISNIIMFDVFHHIRYPGAAIAEINRILCEKGRLIIFEPYISILGLIIYGIFHDESVALWGDIKWDLPEDHIESKDTLYAAQGNAMRVFGSERFKHCLSSWNLIVYRKMASLSYVLSGGFSKWQFYPKGLYSVMKKIDSLCDFLPWLFATRLLIVLEKK